MSPLDADIAHLLAGSMVLLSFLLLYQDRMFALLNVFALHACVLACQLCADASAEVVITLSRPGA